MKILITGGLGFIGSHLIRKYLPTCETIYVVDNLSTNTIAPDSELTQNKKVIFYKYDLADLKDNEKAVLENILSDVSLVFHFASPVGVRYIDDNPNLAIHSNFRSSSELFPLFEKYKNKVIYASSSEVYGHTTDAKEDDVLQIGSPMQMRWGYACGKLMNEFLLKSHSFPFVILRFFNITGPDQLPDYGMVMPSFIGRALRNEDLVVYDDGKQLRSFCDIRDAISMIEILSTDVRYEGQIFNIGNPENLTEIKQLAEYIVEKTGSRSKIVNRNFADSFSKNSADIQTRIMNNTKIKEIYQCQYSIEDIVNSMITQQTT